MNDCIKTYCTQETLTDSERWECSACHKRVCAEKKLSISKTPDILIIHLKRFRVDYRAMYTRKLGEVKQKASNVTLGLEKLEKAAEDVASMSIVLEVEREKLKKATEERNTLNIC